MQATTPVGDGTTALIGAELVRLVKLLVAMRQHMPAIHPAVDHTHYPVLFAVAGGPMRVSDLAGCAHSEVSTVSRQVSHLVAHGLLAKVTDPEDRRAHRVTLTDEGRAVIDRTICARGDWLAAVMTGWTTEEVQDFLNQVARFTTALETAKARAERAVR